MNTVARRVRQHASHARPGFPIAVAPLLAALAILVALPIIFVVLQAVFPHFALGAFDHPFGVFGQTFGDARTWTLLAHTVGFGGAVALSSIALGVPLGALRALFRVPFARVWDLLIAAPFLMPPYLVALGWILLMQPRGYLDQATGVNGGPLLFSFGGMVASMTLTVFPVVYFSVSRALAVTGGRLAEVARVYGAGPWRGFVRITLPLVLPAISASGLLAFTMAIEEFGIPSALGANSGFDVMVTSIEARFSDWPIDLPGASVLSLMLACLALIAFCAQRKVLAGRDFETQNGKPAAATRYVLRGWRWPVLAAFGIVAIFTTLAPLFAIIATAFTGSLSAGLAMSNLTLLHFRALSAGSEGAGALATSVGLAAGTAAVTGVLGFASAWYVVRTRMRGRAALDALTLLPHALPGIVVGVGLILAWNRSFWPITPYNTWVILLLSYSCLLLPYPVRYTGVALTQLGAGLEAASRVHGATGMRTMMRIVLPLVAPTLLWSMLIVFAIASRELVTSLLLAPSGVETASIFIWQQFEQGSIGDGMAMGVVTLAISGLVLGAGAWFAKRFDAAP
ncbi:ABC transporter permease [Paraburkholderia sp. ZP32-5]|uniref:ABC transporter permease n=1 Tax=Paraburkholderia sp. ZP32-5 TaxID=2883245 RepID=UPI001F264417|nr:iron ABC transporter permease [Paraburkholderia sp. ZP32-5]